jgi:hypothetical protein
VTRPATRPAEPSADPPATREISGLITWMRRLSDAGVSRADPAELAAFLHAKRDLLARIERASHARPPLMTSQETPVD